jgi:hypothetical protein
VPLHLTPEGSAVLERWAAARDRAVGQLLAGVPGEQREMLVAAMAAALTGLPRRRPEADATCRTCTWSACGRDCPVDRSVPDGRAERG